MTTARDRLYFDIFVTALEGGIGYWSQCERYHWMNGPPARDVGQPSESDILGFYADINEMDDGWEEIAARHRIDRATIARGYGAAAGFWRNKIAWSTEPPPLVIDDETDWDFDAGDADTIVQLGLGLIDTIRSTGQSCVRYG